MSPEPDGPARPVWVIGASGLMGRHVAAALRAEGHEVLARPVPWDDPEAADRELAAGLLTLRDAAGGGPWSLVWCAGSGVVATPPEVLSHEVLRFRRLLDGLTDCFPDLRDGTVSVASSAGGVYAGSSGLPFTERTEPRAASAYGESKLAMEAVARELAAGTGLRVLAMRVSNLYGPGQDLGKPQGLVSALCRSLLSGEPVPITVAMETRRDFLFAADFAAMAAAAMGRLGSTAEGSVVVKIFDSGSTASIAELLEHAHAAFGVTPPVTELRQGQARGQALDLTLESVVWPDLGALATTSLLEGFRATMADIAERTGHPVPARPRGPDERPIGSTR